MSKSRLISDLNIYFLIWQWAHNIKKYLSAPRKSPGKKHYIIIVLIPNVFKILFSFCCKSRKNGTFLLESLKLAPKYIIK